MFNSIFRKQLLLYMAVLLISFTLLSIALTQAFRVYFTNQKEKTLIAQGEKISSLFTRAFGSGIFVNANAVNQINNQLQIIYEYMDSSFIIIDQNYTIVLASEDIDRAYLGGTLEIPEYRYAIEEGKIVTAQGRIGELYKDPVLSVGYPITIGNNITHAIIMNSSLPELQQTISDAYRIILICLLFSVSIAFILIYVSSKPVIRPLREMNQAAKVIADGDFEKRITVKSKDEVGQLAKSFNDMASGLHEQEKTRREFIANISHDFRSPLTSMRGFLNAIQDGTIPPEKIGYYIDIVLDETERLSKLANDILDLNKVQTMHIELNREYFDLNGLIRKAVQHFETLLKNKNLKMNVLLADNVSIVNADYEKINRTILNLMDNAIKFTPAGGSITIETTVKDNKVYVSVKDTGKGISEEDIKRVFERFYKADASRGEDKKGSGLGLSIAREFIKAHGEEITINSRADTGCEVVFSLASGQRALE